MYGQDQLYEVWLENFCVTNSASHITVSLDIPLLIPAGWMTPVGKMAGLLIRANVKFLVKLDKYFTISL